MTCDISVTVSIYFKLDCSMYIIVLIARVQTSYVNTVKLCKLVVIVEAVSTRYIIVLAGIVETLNVNGVEKL